MDAREPQYVIVAGVTGSGKTTIGEAIAAAQGWHFRDGDALHSRANMDKMRAGLPLSDADRWPWLRAIGTWIDTSHARGESAVIACSALRRDYRDLLRDRDAVVRFCWLALDEAALALRLERRDGHFMPASLLSSQLTATQPPQSDEPAVTVPAAGTPAEVTATALRALGLAPGAL